MSAEGTIRPPLAEADMSERLRAFLAGVPVAPPDLVATGGPMAIADRGGPGRWEWTDGPIMSITYELIDFVTGRGETWLWRDGDHLIIGPYRCRILGNDILRRCLVAIKEDASE